MTFFNLSPLWIVSGIAGLAGVLYLLHQLRVRYTEIQVPTILFWSEAVREAPARVFRERFRHLWSYLLVLLICILLWLGFAGPELDDDSAGEFQVLALDGTAFASVDEDFDEAKSRLLTDLEAIPLQNREVFLLGSHNIKLLAAGERVQLLESRLEQVQPEATRGQVDEFLRLLVLNRDRESGLNVTIYGRVPVSEQSVESLPSWVRVQRDSALGEAPPNYGIVALGVGEAISMRWDHVDVFLRVHSTEGDLVGKETLDIRKLDGAPLDVRIEDLGENQFALRDLLADGSTLEVSLVNEDGLLVDNIARLKIPEKNAIKVLVDENVDESIRAVIGADPGLAIVSEQADVVVTADTDGFPDLPSFRLADPQQQVNAFEIGYVGEEDSERLLTQSVRALGLDQIDGVGIATAMQREIGVLVRETEQRSISVWADLMDERFNFVDSRSFPLFVSNAIGWLSDEKPWFAYLASGVPVDAQWMNPNFGGTIDSSSNLAGVDYSPPRTGIHILEDGQEFQVSLLSSDVTNLAQGTALMPSTGTGTTPRDFFSLISWLILLALALLVVEWYLYQKGYIP